MELRKAWLVGKQASHKHFELRSVVVAPVEIQNNYAENKGLVDRPPMCLLWIILNWCNRKLETLGLDTNQTEPDLSMVLEAICHFTELDAPSGPHTLTLKCCQNECKRIFPIFSGVMGIWCIYHPTSYPLLSNMLTKLCLQDSA